MPEELTYEATSRTVQTKDWKIHYHAAGQGHPIVLLHGSGPGATGWSNFAPNVRALADGFQVIAPDMPGWGDSDAVATGERNHAKAALQLLDALGIDKAAFVGNSMGAMTSLNIAVQHPERISHLITMGSPAPGPGLLRPDGFSEGMKILLKGYQDPSPTTMRELVEIMTFDSSFAGEEVIAQRSEAARKRPDHLVNFLSLGLAGMGRFSSLEEMARIQAPTLLFHGRDDRVVTCESSLRLLSVIPDSRLVLMNRCGHWLQLEHADEFNRLVADFVANR